MIVPTGCENSSVRYCSVSIPFAAYENTCIQLRFAVNTGFTEEDVKALCAKHDMALCSASFCSLNILHGSDSKNMLQTRKICAIMVS